MANEFLQEATKMLTSQSRKKEWYEGKPKLPGFSRKILLLI